MLLSLCLVASLSPASACGKPGEDLAKVYPATMSHSSKGLSFTTGPDDVWELRSFELKQGRELEIRCRRSQVVFGVHGTNVVWAVVFPDDPGEIRSSHPGDGEQAKSILLRFAPAEINQWFPPKAVKGKGEERLRSLGRWVFRHKIGWKWCTPSGSPTIVPSGCIIVDVETEEGPRRFYGINRNAGDVEYVAEFEQQTLPELKRISRKEALEVFDEVWETFDREYAMFVLLPDLDWDRLGKQYRKAAANTESTLELGRVLADMIMQLEDLHAWVKVDGQFLAGYTRSRPLNGNWEATMQAIGSTRRLGNNLVYGRTEDDIGYLAVTGLNDADLAKHTDAALEELADTWGLIVDLRFNGGGSEGDAQQIAGRFVDQERVYAKNQYRNGPKHRQLGQVYDRRFGRCGWRYESPIVALWGRKTLSSAEAFALMMQQCPQATTMGDRTGGSSGNPRLLKFSCGIHVNMPKWLAMDTLGNAIERAGVAPEVILEPKSKEFSRESDPVIGKALEHLRSIPQQERQAGNPKLRQ